MPSYTPLTGPGSIGEAVSPLTFINSDGVELLHGIITSDRSFSPKKPEVVILSERLGLGVSAVEYLFLGLSALYSHIQTSVKDGMGFEDVVQMTADELAHYQNWGDDAKGKVKDILIFLLKTSDNHENYRKIERIKTGFQAHAVAFSSLVELRPKYADVSDEKLLVEGLIPAIQFRITTDDAKDRYHVFQLTQEALVEFKRAIDRLERKVSALKDLDQAASKIIEL